MLSAAAFTHTNRQHSVRDYYRNDVVHGIDSGDAGRLVAEGFLELLPDEVGAPA